MILFFVPWLDKGKVRSIRYRGSLYKSCLTMFILSFLILGYLGLKPTNIWGQFSGLMGDLEVSVFVARICTILYFLFFFLMPIYTKYETTKEVPERL